MNLYRDWDYFASHAEALRRYWFEHGSIPSWNFYFCGGTPELANPQSWAYSWPSLLVYALPPYPALFVLMTALSLAGIAAVAGLLRLIGTSPGPAWLAGIIYGCSGFFFSHYNQGHVTFAFFHLVPVMLWQMESIMTSGHGGVRGTLGLLLSSFMFFTAAMPAPLFYFYPLVPAYLFFKWLSAPAQRRQLWTLLITHGSAVLLAAYKWWPVADWQTTHARRASAPEMQSPLEILREAVFFRVNYPLLADQTGANRTWGDWEYNWFIGPAALLVIVIAMITAFKRRRRPLGAESHASDYMRLRPWFIFSAILVLAGVWLATGNVSPWSPGHFFRHLPFFEGIRVFSRYAGISVFAIALLTGICTHLLWASCRSPSAWCRRLLIAVTSIALLAPVLLQAAMLMFSIENQTDSEVAALHGDMNDTSTGLPHYRVNLEVLAKQGFTYQRYLIHRGEFVAFCYEPMIIPTVDYAFPEKNHRLPLSKPPPAAAFIDGSSILLSFNDRGAAAENIDIWIPTLPEFGVSLPALQDRKRGFLRISGAALRAAGNRFRIEARLPAQRTGLLISIASIAPIGVFLWLGRRRSRHNTSQLPDSSEKEASFKKNPAKTEKP